MHGGQIAADVFNDAIGEVWKLMETEQFPKFMKSMFFITMFNSFNGSQCELPEAVWKEFKVAGDGGVEDGWEYVTETKGVLIHKKHFKDQIHLTCVRGSGIIPLSPEDMRIFATNIEFRERWDSLYKGGRVLQELDTKTCIVQYEFHPPKWLAVLKNQDFVMIRSEKVDADGTIMVLSRSVVHPDSPPRKGFGRGEVDLAGFLIRPCGNNACVVVYITQASVKGIPHYLEKKLINARALTIQKIRKFVEKESKDSASSGQPPPWKVANRKVRNTT